MISDQDQWMSRLAISFGRATIVRGILRCRKSGFRVDEKLARAAIPSTA